MNGTDLLAEISKRIMKDRGTKTVSDAVLARHIGVTQAALNNYKGKTLTTRQVANLLDKAALKSERETIDAALCPIIEYLPLKPVETKQASAWQIFTDDDGEKAPHPYLNGIKKRLERSHGIYVFHDSRGRSVYVGKAHKLTLWVEINNAFNRDRGEVQSIKRVAHPTSRVEYKDPRESNRNIVREAVALHHIATYVSAYEVADGLIGRIEGLIVRTFANDLLNVRMEGV